MEVRDLISLDEEYILSIRNIGQGRLAEIREKLADAGLGLGAETMRIHHVDITQSDIYYHPPRDNQDEAYIVVAEDVQLRVSISPDWRTSADNTLSTLITTCESLRRDLKDLGDE